MRGSSCERGQPPWATLAQPQPGTSYAVSEQDQEAIWRYQALQRRTTRAPLEESEMRYLVYVYRSAHGEELRVPNISLVRHFMSEGQSRKVGALSKDVDEERIKTFYRQIIRLLCSQPTSTD